MKLLALFIICKTTSKINILISFYKNIKQSHRHNYHDKPHRIYILVYFKWSIYIEAIRYNMFFVNVI